MNMIDFYAIIGITIIIANKIDFWVGTTFYLGIILLCKCIDEANKK